MIPSTDDRKGRTNPSLEQEFHRKKHKLKENLVIYRKNEKTWKLINIIFFNSNEI